MRPVILLFVVLSIASSVLAQSSAFTYQGKLNDRGAAANGQYYLVFRIYDTDTNPTPLVTEQVVENVVVTGGVFKVELSFDFPPFTTIAAQWIEVGVRPGSSTGQKVDEQTAANAGLRSELDELWKVVCAIKSDAKVCKREEER